MPSLLTTSCRAFAAMIFVCLLCAAAVFAGTEPSPRHIEHGVLDLIDLHVDAIQAGVPVVIRPFASDKADLGTGAEGSKETRAAAAKTLQREGPALLADSFVAEVKKQGAFPDAQVDDGSTPPENALIIEGEFTRIDPGSKAKRYWVGFGAGKSGLEVKGVVKAAAGQVLAEFTHKRIAVMGVFGGDYEAKLRNDCKSLGEDIAKFVSAWARGEDLQHD